MLLRALGTANPSLHVSQREAYGHFSRLFRLAPDEDALYRKLLLDGPIEGRFIGMDSVEESAESDPDKLNFRFLRHARAAAAEAARRALAQAGMEAEKVDALVVNTCTGYLCPGLTSYVAEDLGLSRDVFPLDIMGMGCGGALPNWQSAAGLLALPGIEVALSISVEICTATLFMGDEPGLVVSNAIFGDGAAASLLVSDRHPQAERAGLRVLGFASAQAPEHREQLRYRLQGGRLKNHLTIRVPALSAKLARQAVDRLLASAARQISDIRWWAIHAGGTSVLDKVGRRLALPDNALDCSMRVFREYGNMSSPSVLFALDNVLRHGRPKAGELGVVLAFGAGLTAFAALVEFTGESVE